MIHAFFVTIGVLVAIRFFPLIIGFAWVTLTSKFFWYRVLWLVAVFAAIERFPYGLIPMAISLPFLLLRFKLREKAEIDARIREYNASRNKPLAPQAPLPFTMGDRYTQDGHEIHYTPRNFTPKQPEQLRDNLVPSRYYAHLYATKAEQMFQQFMPEI